MYRQRFYKSHGFAWALIIGGSLGVWWLIIYGIYCLVMR